MITKITEYNIKCDKCKNHLVYPDTHPLTSYRGHSINEDSYKNIEIVAIQFNWEINVNKHICPNCKIKTT
jgi:hypothetical protein